MALCFMSLAGFCQSNIVIFSEDGDQFYAYVNGVKQNSSPDANVKITGLTSPNVSLRIEFVDKALPQLKQNMVLEPGYEHTARIVRDMKKQMKLKYGGQAPIGTASTPGATTVDYHSADAPAYNTAPADNTGNYSNNTITTTSTTQTYNSGNGGVSINMGNGGISMNMSGMDPNAGGMNSTTSTTVTTTNYSSSSSSSSSSGTMADNGGSTTNRGYTACSAPMNAGSFAKMKQSVESKPFSDTKMSTAKVATKNACLSVNQVKEICRLFNMDEDKLTYAKYAYDYCTDKANYYQVSEVFSFSSSTDELNKYLEQR